MWTVSTDTHRPDSRLTGKMEDSPAGVGNLGEALLGYKAFRSDKHSFRALFDVDPRKSGRPSGAFPATTLLMRRL